MSVSVPPMHKAVPDGVALAAVGAVFTAIGVDVVVPVPHALVTESVYIPAETVPTVIPAGFALLLK